MGSAIASARTGDTTVITASSRPTLILVIFVLELEQGVVVLVVDFLVRSDTVDAEVLGDFGEGHQSVSIRQSATRTNPETVAGQDAS